MFPFLMHGDTVQISSVNIEELKCGDILVFKANNKWIAHRLFKKDTVKNLFYTRGDARVVKDFPIKQSQIKGIIVKTVKTRWKLSRFALGRYGKFIAIISPVTAPVFYLIKSLSSFCKITLRTLQIKPRKNPY
jgi:signal peptidase I